MAKKDTIASEERMYVIPIRKGWLKVPRNQRGKKAVNEVRNFLSKHMRNDNVRLSQKLNEMVWKSGIKKPLPRVKVKISVKEGTVTAMLPEEIEIEKEEKKGKLESLKEKAKNIKGTETVKNEKPAETKEEKNKSK